jgi:hypothetical protein
MISSKQKVVYMSRAKTSQERVPDVQEGNYEAVDLASVKLTFSKSRSSTLAIRD